MQQFAAYRLDIHDIIYLLVYTKTLKIKPSNTPIFFCHYLIKNTRWIYFLDQILKLMDSTVNLFFLQFYPI